MVSFTSRALIAAKPYWKLPNKPRPTRNWTSLLWVSPSLAQNSKTSSTLSFQQAWSTMMAGTRRSSDKCLTSPGWAASSSLQPNWTSIKRTNTDQRSKISTANSSGSSLPNTPSTDMTNFAVMSVNSQLKRSKYSYIKRLTTMSGSSRPLLREPKRQDLKPKGKQTTRKSSDSKKPSSMALPMKRWRERWIKSKKTQWPSMLNNKLLKRPKRLHTRRENTVKPYKYRRRRWWKQWKPRFKNGCGQCSRKTKGKRLRG